jgi:hypothetical protein
MHAICHNTNLAGEGVTKAKIVPKFLGKPLRSKISDQRNYGKG